MQTRKRILTDTFLAELFPPERADRFFDAIYGGAEEGAFDISLEVAPKMNSIPLVLTLQGVREKNSEDKT